MSATRRYVARPGGTRTLEAEELDALFEMITSDPKILEEAPAEIQSAKRQLLSIAVEALATGEHMPEKVRCWLVDNLVLLQRGLAPGGSVQEVLNAFGKAPKGRPASKARAVLDDEDQAGDKQEEAEWTQAKVERCGLYDEDEQLDSTGIAAVVMLLAQAVGGKMRAVHIAAEALSKDERTILRACEEVDVVEGNAVPSTTRTLAYPAIQYMRRRDTGRYPKEIRDLLSVT